MSVWGLGDNIRRMRREKGLTQAQLAGDDWTKGYISLVEHGRVAPSVKSLQLFANKLGCSISDLVEAEIQPDRLHAAEIAFIEGDLKNAWSVLEAMPRSQALDSASMTLKCEVAARLVRVETPNLIHLALSSKSLQRSDRARVLNAWGIYCATKGKIDEALENFEAARELLENEIKDVPLKLKVLANCGNFQAQTGNYDVSLARLQEHLDLSRKTGTQAFAGNVYTTMGIVHRRLGDYDASELFLRRALFAFRADADKAMTAVALHNLGFLYLDLKRLQDAEQFFTEALQMFDQTDARRSITHLELAHLHAEHQNFTTVLSELEQCVPEHLDAEDRVRFRVLKAQCQRIAGDPGGALKTIRMAGELLEVPVDIQVKALQEEAFALMELGRLREAQEAVQKSIWLASRGTATP